MKNRRSFLSRAAALSMGLFGCKATNAKQANNSKLKTDDQDREIYDFIIVGSGAGGGPLAANLAIQGFKVLVLEAGKDAGDSLVYKVPAFHPKSTEDPDMSLDYFVRHYDDDATQVKNTKYVAPKGGVLYPRAGTLGGCTAHNALIIVYPHESDFNYIANVTGDSSWSASNMRRYFGILEKCHYINRNTEAAEGHGYEGWLSTSLSDPTLALRDKTVISTLLAGAFTSASVTSQSILSTIANSVKALKSVLRADVNADKPGRDFQEGFFSAPMSAKRGVRVGPREYLLQVQNEGYPITIKTNALVSRILFETDEATGKQRAVGVEYIEGEKTYRAFKSPTSASEKRQVYCTKEVIVAAGAFNTPQILKLSGIGPRQELESHGIDVLIDLNGVGKNLQDRYEVGVVSQVRDPLQVIKECEFATEEELASADPCLQDWLQGRGVYKSNGVLGAIIKRSATALGPEPDLFIFALPANFKGYYPGYSNDSYTGKRHITWAILKAHTGNNSGEVKLKSNDPQDTPDIRFRYFHEGTQEGNVDQKDLSAMVEGIKLARRINRKANALAEAQQTLGSFNPFNILQGGVTSLVTDYFEEVVPGGQYQSDDDLEEFVRNEAWGHHASCSCKIGASDDPNAVLDSKFTVRGTTNLRVVDASVFPKIPGFFIVSAIYMVSEKATDVILQDYGVIRTTSDSPDAGGGGGGGGGGFN